MKWTVLTLIAVAGMSQAQEFYSSQAARLVIGQRPFTEGEYGWTDTLLGPITGVAYANDTLVVADSNNLGGTPINHRVLIYRNVSSFVPDRKAEFSQDDDRCPACVGRATTVLGQPNFTTAELNAAAQNTLRKPVAVAYAGKSLAVADTDNNRVMIWRTLPTANQQPADLVLGQKDFTSYLPGLSGSGMRGPQGVWLDENEGLWVADTGNNRVLYFGQVTQNGQEAKLVLGQTGPGVNQQTGKYPEYLVSASAMLAPTGVVAKGGKLIVADLGLNRVLLWNAIPTSNGQAADLVLGQPDFKSPELFVDGVPTQNKLCASNGVDDDDNPTYPALCAQTLNLPRAVMYDGKRLFVADSGNDRILIYNTWPTVNAQHPDLVLGQLSFDLSQSSDTGESRRVSSTDSFKTPVAMAWDETNMNLYVSDTYSRRVLVYTPADFPLPVTAVRNAPSPKTFASGTVTIGGNIQENDVLTISTGHNDVVDEEDEAILNDYLVKVAKGDTISTIIDRMVASINDGEGDEYVVATPNKTLNAIILTARAEDVAGNSVTLATEVTNEDDAAVLLTASTSGANLAGGADASLIAPYAIVAVLGDNLTDRTASVTDLEHPLPTELAGVRFYLDGMACPLLAVAPDRVVAQIPVQVTGSMSGSGILRVVRADGTLQVSSAVAVRLIEQNPAVYTTSSVPPSPGLAYHSSSEATGTISVDGTVRAGDTITITIRDREYTYVTQGTDTLAAVRDNLVALINAGDPEVIASAAGPFQRIRLKARVPGPEGDGIPLKATANSDAQVIMTALNSKMCCSNVAGAPVTEDNPAVPGETIVVLASGLGLVYPEAAREAMLNGQPYDGPELNDAVEFVSSLAGGKTANVLFAGLRRGAVGVYEVHLELNPDLPTNPKTQVTIAQSYQVSNVFTIPVANPAKGAN